MKFILITIFLSLFHYTACAVVDDELDNSLQETVYNIDRKKGEVGKKGYFWVFSDKDELINISTDPNNFSAPVFKLNSLKLVDSDKEIIFEDYIKTIKRDSDDFDYNVKTVHDKYSFLAIEPTFKKIYFKFQNFKGNIVEFKDKDRTLYLKLPKTHISDSGKFTEWFFYSNLFAEASQQGELDKELEKYPDFKNLISHLRVCVQKKDVDCLAKYINDSNTIYLKRNSDLVDVFKDSLLRRYIRDDPKTCPSFDAFKEDTTGKVYKDLDARVDRSKSKIWDSMEKALSLNIKYNFIDITSDNFNEGINQILVFKRPLKKLSCSNTVDVKFYFKRIKDNWYLERFNLSDYEMEYGC